MPFITERLWSFINKDSSFLMNELFTKLQINNQFNASQIYFKKLIQVISTVRNFRSELNVPYKELIDINFSNNDKDFIKFLHSYENELKRLLKLILKTKIKLVQIELLMQLVHTNGINLIVLF